jgi:4,5-DOPA dioxygenase extradiol
MRYPAPGHTALAAQVAGLIRAAGMAVELDPERPFDHGAWVPLRAAFPEARIPVIQVSLPVPRTPRMLFDLGRALGPLRAEGVLLLGSGGIVHNLRLLDWAGAGAPEAWASEFEQWVAASLAEPEAKLFQVAAQAPSYPKAVPTSEHFDPLFFALGAAGTSPVRTLFEGWQLGNLSLRTWAWGA